MKETVSRRAKWEQLEPFPDNPIYEKRLQQMGAFDPSAVGVPAVFDNSDLAFEEFSKDTMFVGDGNHRRTLALRSGKGKDVVLVELYRGMSVRQMYRTRRKLNDRRTVKPAEKFLSFVGQGDGKRRLIKETVESLGWEITYERAVGGLSCTNELEWIAKRDRNALIGAIISYEDAWGRMPSSYQATVIKGLGVFWMLYPNAEAEHLAKVAGAIELQTLYRAAKTHAADLRQVRKKVYGGVAYELAKAYNVGRRKKRVLDLTTFRVP